MNINLILVNKKRNVINMGMMEEYSYRIYGKKLDKASGTLYLRKKIKIGNRNG